MSDTPAEALAVLQKFLDASLKSDEATMRSCLAQKTLESGNFSGSGPQGVTFQIGEPAREGNAVIIPVKATPIDAAPDSPPAMEMACVMVEENGEWKFDLNTTMDRMMGGSMQAAMNQVATAMSEAVGGIGEAFASAFGESDDDKPQDWSTVQLVPGVDELLPLPEFTPLPKLSAALTEAVGSPVIAQAAMKDLLQQVASDKLDVLLNWFEDQLFANWGGETGLIAQVAATVPLKDRLRAVRIEAGKYSENRFLAIDGSDLVYRMYINDTAGYYSDDELQTTLPGVLAGLPEEIMPGLTGHRLLANDQEYPSWDVYRERIAPRFMRRIGDVLGKQIRLDNSDWEGTHDPSKTARQMSRWGMNRVYGAIALACFDSGSRERLREELKTIKFKLDYDERGRYAILEAGIFEIGIRNWEGEKGCFYEHELLGALLGAPITGDAAIAETSEDQDEEADEEGEESEDLEEREEAQESSEEAVEDDDVQMTNEQQNAELFASAVAGLRESGEPAWRQQLDMTFGKPVGLTLTYDALGGDYSKVQPFIHQSLSGALGAISMVGFDPAWRPKMQGITEVVVTIPLEGDAAKAWLKNGKLTVAVPLGPEGPPPVQAAAEAIKKALTGETQPPADDEDGESVQAAHDAAAPNDRYAQAADYMDRLEHVMKEQDLWPGDMPAEEIEVKGAFGSENLAFEQWLGWVLIPRVREIVETRGDFPNGSAVAAYAVRAFDGYPNAGPVNDLLFSFDEFVNEMAKS